MPDLALGADQRGHFLYTVGADNVVEYRSVKVGQLVDGQRVIKEGITAQDRVVVNGMIRCRPGLSVSPSMQTETPPTAAPAEGDHS